MMVKSRTIIRIVSVVTTGLILLGATTSAKASEKLKIGAIWGLSGPGSQLQVIMRDAAVLAAEWLNKKGGIKVAGQRYDIELLVEDNKNTGDGSVSAARKLVHRDKAKFITGMIVPFEISAVETITEPAGVVLSSGKAAYLNPKSRLSFSATASIIAPLPGLYDALVKWYPEVKTVAFTAHDEAGAQAVLKAAREIAKTHGLNLQDPILTILGTKDYYPTWTKALKGKPDAVDIGVGFSDQIAANIRQGRELGFKGPVLTPNTGEVTTFVKLIGKEAADNVLCAVLDPGAPGTPAMIKEIARLWKEKYSKPFEISALIGWSSVWALAQAIEKAQSVDPEQVGKAWETMKTIETPWGTGTMGGARTFGINHMVLPPVPISRLKDGQATDTHWFKPNL